MPIVIGIAGRARTGKTTAARYLEEVHGFACFAFADPLKRIARTLMPHWHAWHLEGGGKEIPDPRTGVVPRVLLQEIGAGGRRAHEGLWLLAAAQDLAALQDREVRRPAVWSDVRYPNEAEWIRGLGGTVLHLVRTSAPRVRDHESESGLEPCPADIVYRNDGDLESLYAALDGVVELAVAQRACDAR
jgi:hypothetical protein